MTHPPLLTLSPLIGALLIMFLVALGMKQPTVWRRRNLFVTILFVAAISDALFWSGTLPTPAGDFVTRNKPTLTASLGLWLFKILGMLAGVGIAAVSRISEFAATHLLTAIGIMALSAGSLFVVAHTL